MLPEHKWEIAVLAGSYYTDLTQSFSGNDIALAYDNDYMGMQSFAFSYHIDELDDPADVGRRLYSLQLLLNGALRLSSGKATEWPIVFTDFAAVNGGCRHPVYANTIE